MFKVAIIGRPNVGKSTFFNRLAGKKFALTHDTPGVTRDWRDAEATLYDLHFTIIDTAGIEAGKKESMEARLTKVALAALAQADLALFMVDAREGLTGDDKNIAKSLRKSGKPVILLANKCDHTLPAGYDDMHALGFGEPVAISAEHGLGMRDLYQLLVPYCADTPDEEEEEDTDTDDILEEDSEDEKPLHLAIIGRPNAGKSTLLNALVGSERMLTGPEAGLTRDAVAVQWEYEGKPIRLVDTPGLRRSIKVHETLEKMSIGETMRAIRLAHVVVLVVDANEMLENQDLHIASLIEAEGRALIIAINKWDTIKNREEVTAVLRKFLNNNISQLPDIPIVMVSALKGQKLDKLMDAISAIHDKWNKRIPTSALNKWLEPVLEHHPLPMVNGRRIRIRYITQIKARPPTFALWVTQPTKLPDSYLRYLGSSLRERFDLGGVPLRFEMKKGNNPYAIKKKRR